MPAALSESRYSRVAIALHWMMAIGIFGLAILGLVMTHVALPPIRTFELYQLHKSIGITVLLAAFLRLSWRLAHRPPELPAAMPRRERVAAGGSHLLLYLFLFALPVSGWALVSASPLDIPTVLYGLLPWPHLPFFAHLTDKAPVEAVLKRVHACGAWSLIGLTAVHAAAALRHHFILRDDVLTRMLPRQSRHRARDHFQAPSHDRV
jgi:cytochrome b561